MRKVGYPGRHLLKRAAPGLAGRPLWERSEMKDPIRWARALPMAALLAGASCTSAAPMVDKAPAKEGEHVPLKVPGAPGGGIIVEKNVMVPMRDGVPLATDIYRPAGAGPYPVVLIRTPYGSETADFAKRGKYYVEHGYAF